MKKIYLKPDIAIVDIKPTQLLSGSGDTPLTIPRIYRIGGRHQRRKKRLVKMPS